MLPDGLVKLGALLAAPRVAELVIAQGSLEVAFREGGGRKQFKPSGRRRQKRSGLAQRIVGDCHFKNPSQEIQNRGEI